ncbi:hypothetical protein OPIT5_14465 [Opitutaceae bacterium TAV5]|nr:hypothetical protein OPIT5_14465 [Opitutaceae bacterium TAV5]
MTRYLCTALILVMFLSRHGHAATVSIDGGEQGLALFTPGQAIRFDAIPPHTSVKIHDVTGRLITETTPLPVTASHTLSTPLPPGWYESRTGDLAGSFVVVLPRKHLRSIVGLDAHLAETMSGGESFGKNLPRLLAAANASGAWYLRDRFRWRRFEPAEGQWDNALFARVFQPQLDAGFELVLAIEGNTDWSPAIAGQRLSHPRKEAWQTLLARLTRDYAGKPVWWQVWNEPNPIGIAGSRYPGGITATKYVEHFLRPAHEATTTAARATDGRSPLRLMVGGSAGMDPDWQKAIIQAGALNYTGAFDLHPYSVTPRQFEQRMRDVLGYLDAAGFGGPVFGTEFHSKTPDALAQMYVTWFALDARLRAGALFYFDLIDWKTASSLQPPLTMGLLRTDYTPKPMLAAMNIAANRLAGASPIRTVIESDDASVHLIKDSDGKIFATAWSHSATQLLTLRTRAREITLTPAAGGLPLRLDTVNGLALIPLSEKTFAYIDGDIHDLQPAPDLLKPGSPQSIVRKGHPLCTLPLAFRNPLDTPLAFDIAVETQPDSHLSARLSSTELTLKGNEVVDISLQLFPESGEIESREHTMTLVLRPRIYPASDIRLPLTLGIDDGSRLSVSIERAPDGKLGLLAVNLQDDSSVLRLAAFASGQELKPAGHKAGTYHFALPFEMTPESPPVSVSLKVGRDNGIDYRLSLNASMMDAVTSGLDTQLKQDRPLNRYLAQPFRNTSSTLSSVALRLNNRASQSRSVTVALRKARPDGETIARATVELPAQSGGQWVSFNFPLVRNMEIGETCWIVTETAFPDNLTRWTGRNPWKERPADARGSFEGAAWGPLEPADFRHMGFAHRIFR